ncbi:MAG: O-acetyl-ADP-ribose deacetylase [Armatimonadetes bacterium]|nr:O-acetyl-ADP-ribose deacetylase [Armatimonadota bacterium]
MDEEAGLAGRLDIEVWRGDITKLSVDAVVNAANSSLLGGGGVDGAIHRAAGRGLVLECLKLGGCKVGQAKITSGHRLPAKWIIHTVGPYWRGGEHGERSALKSCYETSLALAESHSLMSIAFPAISTGLFRFPADLAAEIAIETLKSHKGSSLERGIFVAFDSQTEAIYKNLLGLL